MPYKDPERRRQAARKWRLSHREQRAAYMRRYRKARRSGRPPGRPRSRTLTGGILPVMGTWVDPAPTSITVPSGVPVQDVGAMAPSTVVDHGNSPPSPPARDYEEVLPSPYATVLWAEPFRYGRD